METLLFFHGGPGLNSNPEQKILTDKYRKAGIDLICWNEPSELRGTYERNFPETRQEQLLHSAERFLLDNYDGGPICIMSHSMGSQTVCWLLNKHQDKVKAVFLSAPCFDIFDADKNIFKMIENDFQKHGNETVSQNLRSIISKFSENIYDSIINGWKIILENPRLFDYYWLDKDKKDKYLSFFSDPHFTLDFDGFFEIRKTYKNVTLHKTEKRITIFHSKQDPITPNISADYNILKYFPNLKLYNMQKSLHYPHIEESDKVLEIILDTIKGKY